MAGAPPEWTGDRGRNTTQADSIPTHIELRHVVKIFGNWSGSRQAMKLPCIRVCMQFVTTSVSSA